MEGMLDDISAKSRFLTAVNNHEYLGITIFLYLVSKLSKSTATIKIPDVVYFIRYIGIFFPTIPIVSNTISFMFSSRPFLFAIFDKILMHFSVDTVSSVIQFLSSSAKLVNRKISDGK